MTYERKAVIGGTLLVVALVVGSATGDAQQGDEQSCAQTLSHQLRRFSVKCLSDLASYVASQPKMAAKIYSEEQKYYLVITNDGDGIRAEAVSKFNFPLMKDETANALKQLGWMPPENESDNWRKHIGSDRVMSGAAAEELARALSAYGLMQGQAISLTVGTDIGD